MAIDLIRARHPPLEGAMEEADGEVELTLGLSVGGSSRKAPRAAAAAAQGRAAELKPADVELDLGASGSSPSSSRRGPPFCHADGEGGGGVAAALDQAKRREIHALRRREARRKRDEKKQQQKQRRGICRETSGAAPGPCGAIGPLQMGCSSDDRLSMEARERQVRAKDREARVEEALDSVPNHKLSANHNKNPNADANSNPGLNSIHSNPDHLPFAAQSFPMVAMPYSYPHLQYVPTTNGFGISCMMPCWPPGMSPAAERPSADGNVFQPVAFRAFRPYSLPVVEPGNRESPQSSNAVEPNAGTGTGVERAPSWTASQGSSSSPAASGHRSGSLRGGSRTSSSSSSSGSSTTTSDGRSRGELKFHPPLQQAPSLPMGQSDSSISSRPIIEPDLNAVEEPPPERTPTPSPDGSPSLNKNSPAAGDGGPTGQAPRHRLPRMPRVSATGNGPNGRTVTGVLYRYTKSEVSIVCACHGSSFSPAEFVQHAGGTDVTHPLRHITVVSS